MRILFLQIENNGFCDIIIPKLGSEYLGLNVPQGIKVRVMYRYGTLDVHKYVYMHL